MPCIFIIPLFVPALLTRGVSRFLIARYCQVAKEWHGSGHFHLLGVGLSLHVWPFAELLHSTELGTASAAWQGTNAAVLDGRTIEGLAVVDVLHEELNWLTPPSIL